MRSEGKWKKSKRLARTRYVPASAVSLSQEVMIATDEYVTSVLSTIQKSVPVMVRFILLDSSFNQNSEARVFGRERIRIVSS